MRVGLIGDPVEHSRSPRMHNAAFAALGLNHTYELWHTQADSLPERVRSVSQPDIAGANVTVPHKEAVLSLVDEVSETARRIGAVNTINPNGDRLVGDNTDAYGYAASIRDAYPEFAPQRAVVLGAGGASRAVIVALQEMGASEVIIVNRTYARAQKLADELGAVAAEWNSLGDLVSDASIITNATAVGWHDDPIMSPDLIDQIPVDAIVTDLTYANTPLLQHAAGRGIRTLDGSGMLIHQGVRSFELWFGIKPPLDVMTRAAKSD